MPVVLLKPSFGVSTPGAYKEWKDSAEIPGVRYETQKCQSVELVNDLERPVFEKHRMLAETKMWLLRQPEIEAAIMSGSGSTMFGVLRNIEGAEALIQRAKEEVDPSLWTWSGWTAENS
jgi:4-diphosphocytidyl-2-C-methyl-D-erythritol kinase